MKNNLRSTIALTLSIVATILLAGCGGGSSSNPNQASISGNVTKGPTAGASVCAFVANPNGSKGAALGCTTSKSDSTFALATNYSGDVLLEASGGTYTDEATGLSVTLSTPLQVLVSAQTGKSAIAQLTPLTTLGLNQLKNTGVVNSSNYKAAMSALAVALKAKGVLPANASTNLLEDLPVVTGQSKNAYGQALIGVARLMNAGTTLPSIISGTNSAAMMTQLATASSTVLSNSQAQLVLTASTATALTSTMPLCSKEYDKRWAPYYLGMLFYSPGPSASALYSASLEDGTGSNYNPATGVPMGGLCYEANITYQNILGLPTILGTGTTYIPSIAAYAASTKTSLSASDVRCFEDHPNHPYIISDIPQPANPNITNLSTVTEYFSMTEWRDVPTPPQPVLCPVGMVCATLAPDYTFPLQGGPYGQLGQSCWKKDRVWKFN